MLKDLISGADAADALFELFRNVDVVSDAAAAVARQSPRLFRS